VRSIKKFLNLVLTQILIRTPVSSLNVIEDKVQSHLGKGWGAWTTKEETEAITNFVKKQKLKKSLL